APATTGTMAAHVRANEPTSRGNTMPMHATKSFEVKLTPQPADEKADDPTLARMTIDKQIHGDLEGTSHGQMLSAGSPAKESAGYVAIEKVSDTLGGRRGTFVLQHSATMDQGALSLAITVVPGTPTGELEGLKKTMAIEITSGRHLYTFDYTLPPKP